MGTHWFRDVSQNGSMSWQAANLLPIVTMYDQESPNADGAINAFFFASSVVQQSLLPPSTNEWEVSGGWWRGRGACVPSWHAARLRSVRLSAGVCVCACPAVDTAHPAAQPADVQELLRLRVHVPRHQVRCACAAGLHWVVPRSSAASVSPSVVTVPPLRSPPFPLQPSAASTARCTFT